MTARFSLCIALLLFQCHAVFAQGSKKPKVTWTCNDCAVSTAGLGISTQTPPKTQQPTATLPAADYLIITWTDGETAAMAKIMGGGNYFFRSQVPTGNNFVPLVIPTAIQPMPTSGELVAGELQCDAFYFTASINGKSVICLKSNFHPKSEVSSGQYGMAMKQFFTWLVKQNTFKYILTTGTGGGIWPVLGVGDVVVCSGARFDPNDEKLINAGEPKKPFISDIADIGGSISDGKTQFELITDNLNTYASVIIDTINNVRDPARGKKPRIYFAPLSVAQPNYDISDLAESAELDDIQNKHYDTLGATFDNNDAFVAEAFKAAGFGNWVSIRNISDVKTAPDSNTYVKYQYCSAIIGALASYAFIIGH